MLTISFMTNIRTMKNLLEPYISQSKDNKQFLFHHYMGHWEWSTQGHQDEKRKAPKSLASILEPNIIKRKASFETIVSLADNMISWTFETPKIKQGFIRQLENEDLVNSVEEVREACDLISNKLNEMAEHTEDKHFKSKNLIGRIGKFIKRVFSTIDVQVFGGWDRPSILFRGDTCTYAFQVARSYKTHSEEYRSEILTEAHRRFYTIVAPEKLPRGLIQTTMALFTRQKSIEFSQISHDYQQWGYKMHPDRNDNFSDIGKVTALYNALKVLATRKTTSLADSD